MFCKWTNYYNKQVWVGGRRNLNRKDHFGPRLGHKFFFESSAILDVRRCPKLQFCSISRKTKDATLGKWWTQISDSKKT